MIQVLSFVLIGLTCLVSLEARAPILLISLDGYRADRFDNYLFNHPLSALYKEVAAVGVRSHMEPSFPSQNFPNHFTLVTGVRPEVHGVVGNKIYDPTYSKFLQFTPDKYDKDPKYWNTSEPIWITASKQGLKTASSFWIGSEIFDAETDLFLNYDLAYKLEERFAEVVNWYKKFDIDFGALHINDIYDAALNYGPDSIQYELQLGLIDKSLRELFEKLTVAGVMDKLNIIIVGGSGMTSLVKTLVIKDYVSETLINFTPSTYGTVSCLYPKSESVKQQLYDGLKKISNLSVYYKEEVPEHLNFRNNERIGPIVAIADEGYILDRSVYKAAGINGHDSTKVKSMITIFMARGPSFNKNLTIPTFSNVNIYPLLCKLLEIKCDSNPQADGTINPFLNALKETTTTTTSRTTTTTTDTSKIPVQGTTTGLLNSSSSISLSISIWIFIFTFVIFKFN